jgi:hypothetical protein
MSEVETIREEFRPKFPKRITILFVGESAPAGVEFFYNRERPSRLFNEMRDALRREMSDAFSVDGDFLEEFKAKGFFLDDLSLIRVNRMEKPERIEQCRKSDETSAHLHCDYWTWRGGTDSRSSGRSLP